MYARSAREYNNYLDLVVSQLKADVPFWNQDLPIQQNIFGEYQLIPNGVPTDVIKFTSMKRGDTDPLMVKLSALAHGLDNNPEAVDETGAKLNIQMPSRVIRLPSSTKLPYVNVEVPIPGAVSGMPFELSGKMYERFMLYYGNVHEGAVGPTLREEMERVLSGNGPVWRNIVKSQDERSYKAAVAAAYVPFSAARSRALS